ncbi:hypothetical protein IYW40_03005 [Methylocystis sp. H4A]|uniref:hypothetical protein n=1 Tax=Methylocystis sp. H4A TaxID=2785788 RepID=UPI0018C29BB3|nr:hypothetical protein [Methylocystis sp. H4A]MBG0800467.1 hypothetical protein [Methylocystis sp. H4A]
MLTQNDNYARGVNDLGRDFRSCDAASLCGLPRLPVTATLPIDESVVLQLSDSDCHFSHIARGALSSARGLFVIYG